jgi:hypothetical protein
MSSSLGKPEKLPSLVTGLFLNKYFKKNGSWKLKSLNIEIIFNVCLNQK